MMLERGQIVEEFERVVEVLGFNFVIQGRYFFSMGVFSFFFYLNDYLDF